MRHLLLLTLPALTLAWVLAAEPSAEAVRLNEEGIDHLGAGRAAAAVRAFEAARAELPEDPTLARNLAAASAAIADDRLEAGDTRTALGAIERAIDLHPERLRYRYRRGRIRAALATDADRYLARHDFSYVLERDPAHFGSLAALGEIAYFARDLDDAVALWRRALLLRPTDAPIRIRLADAERERAVESAYAELRAPGFVVRFGESVARTQAELVLALCRDASHALNARFDHYPDAVTVVTLYSPAEFRSATRLHGWVAGLSDGTIRLTVTATSRPRSLRATILHEYTHHLVRTIAPSTPGWLHEGLAQIAERKSVAVARARLKQSSVPTVTELDVPVLTLRDPRQVARFYDLALAFTAHLDELGGERAVPELLRGMREGGAIDELMRRLFDADRATLFARWLEGL